MKKEIISKSTRLKFREFLVGRTLRDIEMVFDSQYIHCDLDYNPKVSGQRRTLVEQYYHTIDFNNWSDVSKLIRVYEEILFGLNNQINSQYFDFNNNNNDSFALKAFNNLVSYLERDGFKFENGNLVQINQTPALLHVKTITEEFGYDYISRKIDNMVKVIESDTDEAIGIAKELIESCCKHILEAKNKNYNNYDMPTLVKETLKELKLTPDDIEEDKRISKPSKKILGSLSRIAHGMTELRNYFGDGHGKGISFKPLPPRYAKLAVGAASTWVNFVFETFKERNQN